MHSVVTHLDIIGNCNKITIMAHFTLEKLSKRPPTQSINNSFRSCIRQVNDIYIKTINRDLFCRSGEDSGVRDIWSHVGARNTWAFSSSSDHDHLPDISISGKIASYRITKLRLCWNNNEIFACRSGLRHKQAKQAIS